MRERITINGQTYTVTEEGDHWRVRWYKTPIRKPWSQASPDETIVSVQDGVPSFFPRTVDQAALAHPEYLEALVPKGAQELRKKCGYPDRWDLATCIAAALEDAGLVDSGLKGIKAADLIKEWLESSTPEAAIRQAIVQEKWSERHVCSTCGIVYVRKDEK